MATIKLQRADAVVFQLLRKNLAAKDAASRTWEEVKVVALAVKPTYIEYRYPNRAQVNQTSERGIFVDKFGMGMVHVEMAGTFGSKPRRTGLQMKDGYTRLIEFRDEIVRKSNRVNDELDQKEGKRLIGKNTVDANAKYVYAVNYYDFIYDEMFAINIEHFSIRPDATVNTMLPHYRLSFQEIGDTFKVESKDGLLRTLLKTNEILDMTEQLASDAMSIITDNPVYEGIDLGIGVIETMNFQIENLQALGGMYLSAISNVGAGISSVISSGSSSLAYIKA